MASREAAQSAARRLGMPLQSDAGTNDRKKFASVDVVRLAVVGVFSVLPLIGSEPVLLTAAVTSIFAIAMIDARSRWGLRDFCVFAFVAAATRFPGLELPWPVPLVLPVVVYGVMQKWRGVCWAAAPMEYTTVAVKLPVTLRYAFVGAACAIIGLLGWYQLAAPDLSAFAQLIPAWPLAAIIPAGIAFYSLNAITEELVFRGIVYGQLRAAGLSVTWVIASQALAFGFLHWHGMPGGEVGVALSAIYGAVQGVIRHKSRGLLAPWLSHVVADLTIFAFLLRVIS